MKILVVSENRGMYHNRSHEFFKQEIANQHDVRFHGHRYSSRPYEKHIQDIIESLEFEPDVVFSYAAKWCEWLKGMKDYKGLKIHFMPDYFPWNWSIEDAFIEEHQPDLVLVPNSSQVEILSKLSHAKRLPFSVNTDAFKRDDQQRYINISATMQQVPRYYPTRIGVVETISIMTNSIISIWIKSHTERLKRMVIHKNYVDLLSRSKIVVNCTTYKGLDAKLLNPRFLEATACGALLLTEPADDMKIMGFKPGINCDTFNDIDEMKEKIDWYLENDEDRERVARNGERLTREYHSCERRVKQLTKMIERTTQ